MSSKKKKRIDFTRQIRLTDLEIDFFSLLSCVLIIFWSTHNLASIVNIKQTLHSNSKLQLFLKIASYFCQILQICQICL